MSWTNALSKIKTKAPICVSCGVYMTLRHNIKDDKFWGCVNYPVCKKTKPVGTAKTSTNNLTAEQQAICNDVNSRVSVIATAGSGKTTALIAKALQSSQQFIFLTFNRKATEEVNRRLKAPSFGLNRAMTLHAAAWICANTDKPVTPAAWYGAPNEIKANRELQSLISKLISRHFYSYDSELSKKQWRDIRRDIVTVANKSLATLKIPDEITDNTALAACANNILTFVRDKRYSSFEVADTTFEFAANALSNKITADIFDGCQVVIVDEAQDISPAQWQFIDELVVAYNVQSLVICGDDQQAIYGWRHANIQNFIDRCLETTHKVLSINFRCKKNIVNASKQLIEHNLNRVANPIKAYSTETGKISVLHVKDAYEEATVVIDAITSSINNEKSKYNEWLVMARTNAALLIIEKEFIRNKIPYNIAGKHIFSSHVIKTIRSFLCGVQGDIHAMADAVVELPGIGSIAGRLLQKSFSVESFINNLVSDVKGCVGQASAKNIKTVYEIVLLKSRCKDPLHEFVNLVVNLFFPEQEIKSIGYVTEEQSSRDIALGFVSFCKGFNSIEDVEYFIAKIRNGSQNAVTLSTVHRQKGTEANHVVILEAVNNVFPHRLSISSRQLIEAERRLFYVAITRSCDSLMILVPETSYLGVQSYPSQFIAEAGLEIN